MTRPRTVASWILLVAVAGASTFAALRRRPGPPGAGDRAPAVRAARWLNVRRGQEREGPPRAGRVVVVEFSASWCGPCRREMPALQRLWERWMPLGLTVMMVSNEEPGVLEPFLRERAYAFPVACDSGEDTVRAFCVRSWPTCFVVAADGSIVDPGEMHGLELVEDTIRGALPASARARVAPAPPVTAADLREMVAIGRRETAVDALLDRAPTPEVLREAARSALLVDHAASRAADEVGLARAAILLDRFVFPDVAPRSRERLAEDLGAYLTSLPGHDETGKALVGLRGEWLRPEGVRSYVGRRLARAGVFEALSRGEPPDPESIGTGLAAREATLVDAIRKEQGP